MEYDKAKKLIGKIVEDRIKKLSEDAEELGLTEETAQLFIGDIIEAFNILSDIGEMRNLKHDNTKKYNHAMDLAFEVWSNDLYNPTIDEILAGMWRRVAHFFRKENHFELKEAVSTFDVYKNEDYKEDDK